MYNTISCHFILCAILRKNVTPERHYCHCKSIFAQNWQNMRIGIIREGKIPPDERTPLTPEQIITIRKSYPHLEFVVQKSAIRRIPDEEYARNNIPLADNISDCDLILGVKEVPIDMLIPYKTYIFFSHTIKKQPHNKKLLKAIVDKKITLLDWELFKKDGHRLIGFGYFAGIVGTYNTLRAWGIRKNSFLLNRAYQLKDKNELYQELEKVKLPSSIKIIITGNGRVNKGIHEVLTMLKIKEVSPKEYLNEKFDHPVYTNLNVKEYFRRKDGRLFSNEEFYQEGNNKDYESNFLKYAIGSDILITGHYWDKNSPSIIPPHILRHPAFSISIIGDISCDVNGPIASTVRSSTIESPYYYVDPVTLQEVPENFPHSIMVMAVDNLPCELPRDASQAFGNDFITYILPELIKGDESETIKNATIVEQGSITERFKYLEEWINS